MRENTVGVFSRVARKTTQNKRECYNKTFSQGWGGVTDEERAGTFLIVFRAVLLAKRGTEGTVGGFSRRAPAGAYFAPPPFKNYNRRYKSFVFTYVCYYDTHICSMFHVPFFMLCVEE